MSFPPVPDAPPARATAPRSRPAAVLAASLLVLAGVTVASGRGVPLFADWYYQLAWLPLLVAMDASLALWDGRWRLFGRPGFALSLFGWSVPAWLVFELLNLRIANWYYVAAPDRTWLRWGGAAVAFSTVLPAVYLGYRWAERLGIARGWRGPTFRLRRSLSGACLLLGTLFLLLALWRPRLFFPLVWGAATLLLEPYNLSRDPDASLLGDLAAGRWGRPVRLLAGGLLAGIFWETLNVRAGTRWIYTVPGLEHVKLFEMPVPGFLGFPVFALDCFVMYRALVNAGVAVAGWAASPSGKRVGGQPAREAAGPGQPARPRPTERFGRRRRTALAAALALCFSLVVLREMDRWTVDSLQARLSDVVPDSGVRGALEAAGISGVRELAVADSVRLARTGALSLGRAGELVRRARLSRLRGIGPRNAEALQAVGIGSVAELARAEPGAVGARIAARETRPRAGYLPRVRVWIRAAREAGPDESGPRSPRPAAEPEKTRSGEGES